MKYLLLFLLWSLFSPALWAKDSLKVVRLLHDGIKQPASTNLPLYYAHLLKGTPYMAATLEVNPNEQLVVNLHQLDCTTLVETCLALTLTTQERSTRYEDYCKHLMRLRYRLGRLDGYASRNHYFQQWIWSNESLGLVTEITSTLPPFTAVQRLDLHYMSQKPHLYPMLKNDTAALRQIRQYEQESSGISVRYIPRSQLDGTKSGPLGIIQDGDILAIVTKKAGLDTSHLGLAQWGKDGKLHLLNASQVHKKTVLEPMTLYQYMDKHPSQLGIRVIRLK